MSNVQFLTREELYELVWSTPITKVAGQFGISDVAFRKRCRKYDIPLPERGYWAKLKAGKKVAKASLPEPGLGMPEKVPMGTNISYAYHDPHTTEELLHTELPPPPTFDESISNLTARAKYLVGRVGKPGPPDEGTRPHY